MSIASAITNAQQKVANAYDAVDNKGGTLPATQDLSNLPTAINSIPTSSTPTLDSLTITPTTSQQSITPPSGVDGYDSITVNAVTSSIDSNITAGNIKDGVTILGVQGTYTGGGGGVGIPREVVNGVYQMPTSSSTFSLPSNATSIGTYALADAFRNSLGLTSVDLSSLTSINGDKALSYAFYNCTNLTGSIDLSNLLTISSTTSSSSSSPLVSAFENTGITSVDLSSLTSLSGYGLYNTFRGCTSLTSVDLSSLETVSNYDLQGAFRGCTSLTSVDLSSLETVNGSSAFSAAFYNCDITGALDLSSLISINQQNCMNSMFRNNIHITSVNLSSLTDVATSVNSSGTDFMGSTFQGCTALSSVDFSNLTNIGINSSQSNYGQLSATFKDCSNLTTLSFPKLEKIYCTGNQSISSDSGTFADNNYIEKMYFPKLDTITYGSGASTTNQSACKNVFYGCSALTELHFGAANQSAIEASPGYSTLWGRGAGSATVYFDL